MIKLEAKVIGGKFLESRLKGLTESLRAEINRAVDLAAVNAHRMIIESMGAAGKTGRKYKRGRFWHQASAPGQPPARDTGRMASSTRIGSLKASNPNAPASVSVNVRYGAWLETGTKKVAPRPFFKPVFDVVTADLKDAVHIILKRVPKK